jgi:hypothetical protein
MTNQKSTQLWSNIDDSQAESISGGYSYQFLFGTLLVTVESSTLIPALAPGLVPGLATATAAPVTPPTTTAKGFTISYSPNPIPGGPLVETRTPIFQLPTSIQTFT